jgi:hypothetical protein
MNLEQLKRMRSLVAMQTPNSDRAQLEKQLALQNIETMIEQCKAKV